MSDEQEQTPKPPVMKRRSLVTGLPAGDGKISRPKLATAGNVAPTSRFHTPGAPQPAPAPVAEGASNGEAESQQLAQEETARIEAERQRLAAEEAARIEAEQQRIAAEEAARIEAERQRLVAEEAARIEAERQRLAAEEAARIEAERQRLAAEEAARIEAERQRLAAEEAVRIEAERQKLAAEQAARAALERERLAAEQAVRAEEERRQLALQQAAREEVERQQLAAHQSPTVAPTPTNLDPQIQNALDQLKAAQEALIAAQSAASLHTSGATPVTTAQPATTARPTLSVGGLHPQQPATTARPSLSAGGLRPQQPATTARPSLSVAGLHPQQPATKAQPATTARPSLTVAGLHPQQPATKAQPATTVRPSLTAGGLRPQQPATKVQPATTARPSLSAGGLRPQQPATTSRPSLGKATTLGASVPGQAENPQLDPNAMEEGEQVEQGAPVEVMDALQKEAIAAKKKLVKTLTIGGIVVVVCGSLLGYKLYQDHQNDLRNKHYKELSTLGMNLGVEARELGESQGGDVLKYDPAKSKYKVKADKKEAQFLMSFIRNTTDQTGALSAIHLLCVMGQLDPLIASMITKDMGDNYKAYTKKQLSTMTSILASSGDSSIMRSLGTVRTKLGAAKQKEKEAEVLRTMRIGMKANDVAKLMKELLDDKTDDKIVTALGEVLPSIASKASDAEKELVADSIISALKGRSSDKELDFKHLNVAYQALSYTGCKQALSFFSETIKSGSKLAKSAAIQALKYCENDAAVTMLQEFVGSSDPELGTPQFQTMLNNTILAILGNGMTRRSDDQGRELFKPLIDRAENLAKDAKAKPDDKQLADSARQAKMMILSAAGIAKEETPYITEIFDLYSKDADEKVVERAKKARETIKLRKEKASAKKAETPQADRAAEWEAILNKK